MVVMIMSVGGSANRSLSIVICRHFHEEYLFQRDYCNLLQLRKAGLPVHALKVTSVVEHITDVPLLFDDMFW